MTEKTVPSIIERVLDDIETRGVPAAVDPATSHVQKAHPSEGGFFPEVIERVSANALLDTGPLRFSGKFSSAPESTLEKNRIVAGKKGEEAAERFDLLRTRIVQEMKTQGWRTLGITSPMPGSGKTTVAINLSISIAKGIHQDVVLVDLDLRNPTIAEYMGIDATPGLSELLDGQISFQEPFVNPGIPRLLIIPNKEARLHSSEALTSPAALRLAHDLRRMADVQVVVYDLPPVLPTDDVLAFMPEIDCLLVVLADGVTTKEQLADTQGMLKNANVLGYVLNQI